MASTVATNRTILVVAPATLEEDFTFDVTLGGHHGNRQYTVTVPKGGVKEGEEFEIPYPGSDEGEPVSDDEEEDEKRTQPSNSRDSLSYSDDATGAPRGRWRTHLCACCDVITQATFWVAFFCSPVLIAQLATRLKLTYSGGAAFDGVSLSSQTAFGEAREETSLTYNKVILSFVAVLFLANFVPVVGLLVVAVYIVSLIVYVGGNIRRTMRRRYKIAPRLRVFHTPDDHPRNGCFEDYFCMLCCGHCALIQMARHTHNDKDYPGYCCTTTGLEAGAPRIV